MFNNYNLLNTKRDYVFKINVIDLMDVVDLDPDPSCPRANSWHEILPNEDFIETPGTYTHVYEFNNKSDAGVDVFCWNNEVEPDINQLGKIPQKVALSWTGNPYYVTDGVINLPEVTGDALDQDKYAIRYNVPGTYEITILVYPDDAFLIPCGEDTLSLGADGHAFPSTSISDVSKRAPHVDTIILGQGVGWVQVRGSAKAAPDRMLFYIGDNNLIKDTNFRGLSSENYADNINDMYSNLLPGLVEGVDVPARQTPLIEEATVEYGINSNNSNYGYFEFMFYKDTNWPFMDVYTYSCEPFPNDWEAQVTCPITEYPEVVMGFNMFGYVHLDQANAVRSIPPIITDANISSTNLIAGNSFNIPDDASAFKYWVFRSTSDLTNPNSVLQSRYFRWTITNNNSLPFKVTGIHTLLCNRTGAGAANVNVRAIVNGVTTILADVDDIPIVTVSNLAHVNDNLANISETINQTLSNTDLIIPPNGTCEFRIIPYNASTASTAGRFRIYGWANNLFNEKEDIGVSGEWINT